MPDWLLTRFSKVGAAVAVVQQLPGIVWALHPPAVDPFARNSGTWLVEVLEKTFGIGALLLLVIVPLTIVVAPMGRRVSLVAAVIVLAAYYGLYLLYYLGFTGFPILIGMALAPPLGFLLVALYQGNILAIVASLCFGVVHVGLTSANFASTRPTPFLDAAGAPLAGGISEKITVRINGVDQGMFIKGRDVSNPVLLYVHGGMPDYFLTERYPTGLDEDFTVVWWEQRGSGLSYDPAAPPGAVTSAQLVSDALAVTNYLRHRFAREKIYLMGHSGGTFIGIQAAARAPDLFNAYIAVAQMSHQLASEQLAYAYMLQRYTAQGNTSMVRRLARAPVSDTIPLPALYLKVRDVAMHGLGIGTMHRMTSIVSGLVLPSLLNGDNTLREKFSLWRGKLTAGDGLWNEELATDLTRTVPRLEIPVYFLHGVFDYTVSYPLAHAYYASIIAPVKGFFTFRLSAHSPLFEEPAHLREIMRKDVLTGTRGRADP